MLRLIGTEVKNAGKTENARAGKLGVAAARKHKKPDQLPITFNRELV